MERLSKIPISALHGKISEETYIALVEFGFQTLTDIQAKSIPRLLTGCDGVVSAKTGSGKTLAFLIPAIELLLKGGFKPTQGTGVLIISPTRELCIQIHMVAEQILKYHNNFSHGLVIGGTNRNVDRKKLGNHVNILVATPGRLLDHLQTVPNFVYKNLKCLILDEADRILDQGFERDMTKIINILPKKRQTLLFSATLTKRTENLIRLALKSDPVYIGIDEVEEEATIEGLNQGFILCPAERKLLLLLTFLRKNKTKKVMVFFSTCQSVIFHDKFFKFLDLPVTGIQGHQKQNLRTKTYMDFCKAESGTLLCTDVAARGLDIPKVDWIIQFDPPSDAKEYIHRVGRTARGENVNGNALLIILPEEQKFLQILKSNRIPIKHDEFQLTEKTLVKQNFIQDLISKNPTLENGAKKAFRSYLRAYKSRKAKLGFDIKRLDLKAVAKSFGFNSPPIVKI